MHNEPLSARARAYIGALELPPAPPRTREADGRRAPDPAAVPALAVGQNLVEFGPGAEPALRPVVTDALLLAQLAADKADANTPEEWYEAQRSVLSNIGFLSSGLTRTTQDFSTTKGDLHEAILPLITAAFAGAAIPAIILETLGQLSAASENRPWIQLFERESRRFGARQFQVSLVEGTPQTQSLTMLGFALEITQSETQVLFFRHADETAAVERIEGRFTAENRTLTEIAPDLAAKLTERRQAYLKALEI